MQAIEISKTGLDVEWRRLEVIAENLANASTTRTALGGPYQPRRVVSGPRADFATLVNSPQSQDLTGVQVYGIEAAPTPTRRVFEPGHPHADGQGFVTYPGLDHAGEMTLMVQTARVYEANLIALATARQMYAKALELGKR